MTLALAPHSTVPAVSTTIGIETYTRRHPALYGPLPASMTAHLTLVLGRHQADAHLAAVLAVLEPYTQPEPTTATTWVPVELVLRLERLLPSWPAGLLAAVLLAARPWLPPHLTPDEAAAERLAVQRAAAKAVRISVRELEVVTRIAAGLPSMAIGRELFVSEDTVKSHIRRLFAKLGVRDRAAAVARCYQLGILGGDQ